MRGRPIKKFISYKEPHPCDGEGGIIFRSHVVMSDGQHIMISDSRHGSGFTQVDETLAFLCNEEGEITDWGEVAGGRCVRTDLIVNELNDIGYSPHLAD